ncbi:Eyes absent-like protein 4 [Hordeum vulgare]|nr:Eyes absent-like protein 4 [Hordeum vulgare]
MPADMLIAARNLFGEMPATVDDDTVNRFLENMIFEGGALVAAAYDPDETQSQDGRAPFTQTTNDTHDAFMQDQVVLDGFPLDHEFPEDYGLQKEDDDMDIDVEPLFEEELANQTATGVKPKHKSKRTKAYTLAEDKLLCVPSFEGIQVSARWQSLLSHPLLDHHQQAGEVQGAICRPMDAWGKEVVEDHGDGEKAQPRGETNSRKEDKWDAKSIALLEKVEGMISKKDLRKEKRRQEKEEQMHAFMEIQRRRLEMDAERQAKMLELEEAKQAKMLEIEATNAKTKAKEVAIANMKMGVKIMKVDLNTVSPIKRLWFEKKRAKMLKFDQL